MRTVTFSRPDVQALLDDRFVSTWFNQAPNVFPVGSSESQKSSYPKSYYTNFPDGAGGANVKLFFCTPDGKIVHFAQGYLKPETLRVEAEFALQLLKLKDPTKAQLIAAHTTRIAALQKEDTAIQTKGCKLAPADALKVQLLRFRVNNHRLAQARVLEDP